MRAKIVYEGKMRANEGALMNEGKVASLVTIGIKTTGPFEIEALGSLFKYTSATI